MSDKVEFVAPEDLEKYVKENSAPFMSDANIKAALKKLKLPESLPFEERMRIDSEDPEDVVVKDVEDDKERELAFYKFALMGAIKSRKLCRENGIPFNRPDDYFAEMLKSDDHMFKIQARVNREKKKVETAEQNRQKKHIKKFAKTFQQERTKLKKQLAQKKIAETEKFKRQEKKYGENSSRGVGKFGKSHENKTGGKGFHGGKKGGFKGKGKK